jgi:hypothetical protein
VNDHSPATGFSRAYFGCFGVLAAIATVIALGLIWLAVSARQDQAANKAALAASPPPPVSVPASALPAICDAARKEAEKTYAVKGHLRKNGAPTLGFGNAAGTADCPSRDAAGEVEIDVRFSCADVSNPACRPVDDVIRIDDLSHVLLRTPSTGFGGRTLSRAFRASASQR